VGRNARKGKYRRRKREPLNIEHRISNGEVKEYLRRAMLLDAQTMNNQRLYAGMTNLTSALINNGWCFFFYSQSQKIHCFFAAVWQKISLGEKLFFFPLLRETCFGTKNYST
jgi:hypothetical protein